MSRGWLVLAGWGLLLVALGVVQLTLNPKAVELALAGGAGALVAAVGALALRGERRRSRARPFGQVSPEGSPATVALAIGISVLVVGWEVGAWLTAVGGGIAAWGLFGLLLERRSAP